MNNPIAVITDLHFGKRKNCPKFLESQKRFYYEQFIPCLKEEGIKYLYILGDVFDSRNSINVLILNEVMELFKNLSFLDKIYIICGNHDIVYSTSLELKSIDILDIFPNVVIIDMIGQVNISNKYNDLFIPWQVDDSDLVNNVKRKISGLKKPWRIFGHLELAGAKMTAGITCKSEINLNVFDQVDSIWSGHFHIAQEIGKTHYIGAPYQLDRGDKSDDRGFYILSDDENPRFIKNEKSAEFIDIIYNKTEYGKNDIENNIIDFYIRSSDYSDKKYMEELEKLNSMNPLYEPEIKIMDDQLNEEVIHIKNMSLKDMLLEYTDQRDDIENKNDIVKKLNEMFDEESL